MIFNLLSGLNRSDHRAHTCVLDILDGELTGVITINLISE